MKKKIITIIIAIAVIIAVVVCLFKFVFNTEAVYIKDVDSQKLQDAYDLLKSAYLEEGEEAEVYYTDFIKQSHENGEGNHDAVLTTGKSAAAYLKENREKLAQDNDGEAIINAISKYDSDIQELPYRGEATYKVTVDKAGLYTLAVDYMSVGDSLSDYTVSVNINGKQAYSEMDTIALPIIWSDVNNPESYVGSDTEKKFDQDSYGDEMALPQERVIRWYQDSALYNNTYVSSTPLTFELEKGENTITILNATSGGLALGKLVVKEPKPVDSYQSYEQYAAQHADAELVQDDEDMLEIDSVYYSEKNSTDAIYGSTAKTSLTRYNIDNDRLNTLEWNGAGIAVTYRFNVKKTGNYNIAFHCSNEKKEFDSFETILIDGEIPFAEMYNYSFEPVGSGYQNVTLSDEDGKHYNFYLTEGIHTLTIKQENEPVMEAYRYATLLQEHITDFELEITKITGSDVDAERNWKMTNYIPNIESYLESYQTIINHIRFLLQDYSENGVNGAILAYLDEADQFITDMKKYPDDIALHTADLTGADNSVLVSLSNFTTEVISNDFTLDRIYIYGDDGQLEKPNSSWASSLWTSTMALVNTFTSDKYSAEIVDDGKTITIWVNRAITHVDLLQKMADTEFVNYYKEKTGKDIKVKIATMPDVNKLTLAIAADETPDIALGLMSYVPFDLSSRGALYDMTQFDDFWSVANRFPAGSFVSYVYNDGMYAIPETTDFNAIIYRTDIFGQLGLECPSTWEELIDILPTLQRYGMNFYHNISLGTTGYKWFYQTAPMILQNGGKLYVQDQDTGLVTTGVDSKDAVRGLQMLGDLFTKYSLETSVNSFFNSFRYSVLPIGIVGMEDYTLIKNGAQELNGNWELKPYLYTETNGEHNASFVANGTGGVIFKKSGMIDESWEFLKWWTSKQVQTEYTQTLRSTYGKTFFWLSANKAALENNPMDEADKRTIMNQIDYVTDVPRTPGQYLLERTISNIWTSMVFDGVSAQVAVDEEKSDVNKEIVRKMQELGFYDDNGKLAAGQSFVLHDDAKSWILEQMSNAVPEESEIPENYGDKEVEDSGSE